MKIKYVILAGCLWMGAGSLQAQSGESNIWDLRRCIDYAIENNIEIKQYELDVEGAELSLNTSKHSRLPDLNGNAGQGADRSQTYNPDGSYDWNTGEYEEQTRSFGWAASTSFGLSSSTTIYAGSRIKNQIKADELNLKAAVQGLSRAKEDLSLQVTAYYLDVLFKKEVVRMTRNQVLLTQEQRDRTEVLLKEGKIPESQLYDIKAQLAGNEVLAVTAEQDRNISILNLAQLMNVPDVYGFDILEPDTENILVDRNRIPDYTPDDIYDIALGIKPHIQEAEYRLENSKSGVKIAQSGLYPHISLSMGIGTSAYHNLKSGSSNTPFFDQLWDNRRESFGINMGIPIFNRMQTRNQVRSAKLNVKSRQLQLDNVKLNLNKEIQQAYSNAMGAEARYVSTEAAYRAALESFQYMAARYELGKATVFEYNETQQKMINSQLEHIQAKYDYVFRAKILDFYRGEPLDIK